MARPLATVELDTTAFQRALIDYTAVNRRDRAMIVNNKARDLMFQAARHTPKARPQPIRSLTDNWPLRTWLGMKAGATTRKARAEASAKMIRGRRSSIGFMRSGFVKAGRRYKATMDLREGKQVMPPSTRNRNSTARTTDARPGTSPVATFDIRWQDREPDPGKDRMVARGLGLARWAVATDMARYTQRKMRERARTLRLAAGGILP